MKEIGGEGKKSEEQTRITGAQEPQQSIESRQLFKKDLPSKESHKPKTIEITGPVKMEPGQNFYDQFPFKEVIAKASEHTKIESSDLRHLLSRYVHTVENPDIPDREKKKVEGMHLDVIEKLKPVAFRKPNPEIHQKENIRKVLRGICNSLDKTGLPDWRGYIAAKHTEDVYGNNGAYRPRGWEQVVSEPTYMAWAEERILRDRRIQTNSRIIAVHESFPQQTQGQSINEAVPEIGDRRETRTWRIIQGSGIKGTR